MCCTCFFFFKQKTAYEMRISDWSSDVCSSDLEVSSVREQLADYRLVRFDMTRSDAEQRALLDRYQLFGPPALQLFAPSGVEWQDLRPGGEPDAESFLVRLRPADDRIYSNQPGRSPESTSACRYTPAATRTCGTP